MSCGCAGASDIYWQNSQLQAIWQLPEHESTAQTLNTQRKAETPRQRWGCIQMQMQKMIQERIDSEELMALHSG